MSRYVVMINGYNVVPHHGHYEIYKNGIFIQACECNELNQKMQTLLQEEQRKEQLHRISA